ncbi:MAG: Ig-like domain-containing protein [Bacteroidales bacterium]|nr:Ig-like domain-containing protein [Bacteroidales bacterium]
MNVFKTLFLSSIALFSAIAASAEVAITEVGGWFESGYVIWAAAPGQTYSVSVRPEGGEYAEIDDELVRNYGSYGRADMVGLKAGNYQFKVKASNGDVAESSVFTAVAHDRSGFAHDGMSEGIGAYKNDGTLKDNARVIYVNANNAKTVKCFVMGDKDVEYTGLQAIIAAFEKGKETRPLDIRIIGTLKAADLDALNSSEEGLQVKGKNGTTKMNITIEGIGCDAAIHSFGLLLRNTNSVELRNFAILNCMDDCVSLDTDNHHDWIHNMDFFYGAAGGDADQAKGDGTVDIKGKSSHITVSYNHFFDSGKCSLGGMKGETTDCWMTYHHNWFDHSDSRHPRIRTAFYHCYNNYYDGVSKYGIGCTSGGSSLSENNYYRNTKYPYLISHQGSDSQGKGTFSGENSGVIKCFNDKVINAKQVLYYDGSQTDGFWDVVKVSERGAAVTVNSIDGSSYNATADEKARQVVPASVIDPVEDVALICRGEFAGREGLGAGRMNGGDFKWTFKYQGQDENYAVIAELKSAIVDYKSTLVGNYVGETSIKNGGATTTVDGGDGKGVVQAIDETTPAPSWGSSVDIVDDDMEEEVYLGNADGSDYYFVGESNVATTNGLISAGKIVLEASTAVDSQTGQPNSSSFNATYENVTYKKDSNNQPTSEIQCQTEHVGSLQLGKSSAAKTYNGGSAIFYCEKGVTTFKIYTYRTGTSHYQVLKSTDGENFTEVDKVEGGATGILKKDFSAKLRDTESTSPVWIKIVNGSTGGLNIQGVLIKNLAGEDTRAESDLEASVEEKTLNIGESYTIVEGTDYTTSSTGVITYTSSNSSIASVDASGKIVALKEGVVSIRVAQVKDDNYKAGAYSLTVTVVDSRAASVFALESDDEVALKIGGTAEAQIEVSGAAGVVSYTSNATSVATVDADGKITAVATGSAIITVTDSGTDAVKGASVTVNVNVTKDMTGTTIVTFNRPGGSGIESSNNALVSYNSSTNGATSSFTYDGSTYKYGAKLESSTEIYITPSSDCKVTMVFNVKNKNIVLNGKTVATDKETGEYTFDAVGGQKYTLKKGDSMNLYLVIFEPKPSTPTPVVRPSADTSLRNGKCIENGKIVIYRNGVKYNLAGQRLK